MVDFYVSWCPGISKCDDALEYVRNSKLIKGVEGSYESDCFYRFEELGLNYSYHNPTFKEFDNISDENFISDFEKNKLLRDGLKISAPGVVGFHPPKNAERFENFTKNMKFIQSKFDFEVLIEPRPYWLKKDFENKKGFERSYIQDYLLDDFKVKISSLDFLEKYMEENNFGMLLDISHTRITILSLIDGGFIDDTLDGFYIKLAKRLGNKIKQIHINHSKFTDGVYLDSHSMLEADCEAVRILKLISPYLKNIEFITLEITTGFKPLEHVKELEKEILFIKDCF